MDELHEHPMEPARRRSSTPLIVALAAVQVGLVAGLFWLANRDSDSAAAARASAEEVAAYLEVREPEVTEASTEVVGLLLNYDSTNIEEVSEEILGLATGGFRDDYEDIVGGGNLKRALKRSASSSRGQILDGPDVFFRSPSEAVAIVTVSQTAQSESNPAGTSVDYVMQLTLVETNEGWKADAVKILSEQRA